MEKGREGKKTMRHGDRFRQSYFTILSVRTL